MGRGRPVKSQIRQNIVELLYFMKEGYGYDIYRQYKELFPSVSMRVIYYHLKKGVQLGEFKLDKVQKEKGDFSWGNEVEKTYYCLGTNAKPQIEAKIKDHIDKRTARGTKTA